MNHDRAIARLRQELAMRPIRVPTRGGGSVQPKQSIQIIGGNTVSGADCIKYASTVTPAAVYDPDVTTAYPDGLGRGWLFINGVIQSRRVLVRHAFVGYERPVFASSVWGVLATTSLSYDPGTGPVSMTAYLLAWP